MNLSRCKRLLYAIGLSTLIWCPQQGNAKVLFSEDFDYPIGESLENQTGWEASVTGYYPISITNAPEFAGYHQQGNAVCLNGASYQVRTTFESVTEGSCYVAFVCQYFWSDKNQYFFALWDGKPDVYNFPGRIYGALDGSMGLSFSKNTDAVYSEQSFDSMEGNPVLVVLRYDIIAGENNDQVRLYVLDKVVAEEPETATIGPLSNTGGEDITPSGIVLRQFSAGAYFVLDGVRVATTWKELFPAQSGITNAADGKIGIYSRNGNIRITGAEGETARIYNLQGVLIASQTVRDETITGNFDHAIIVRVGNTAKKILP